MYGWSSKYLTGELGGRNSRLDEMQAAILRVKLRHLDDWNAARRRNAATYAELLKGTGVIPPYVIPGSEHVYHIFGARMPKRDAVMAALGRKPGATLRVEDIVDDSIVRELEKSGFIDKVYKQ